MIELVNQEMLNKIIKFYALSRTDETPCSNAIIGVDYFSNTYCSIKDTLKTWAYNKQNIFELFGKQLKIEVPLKNITLPEQVASESLQNFLDEYRSDFNPLILTLLSKLNPDELINNILSKDFNILNVQLKKGWKVSKCFKSLEISEEQTKRQQDLYSRFIQTLKINGTLVLSIDPIDYITMSCSQSNWASCHHPNRDYGTGSMFYMSDKNTIITYVKSNNNCKFQARDNETKEVFDIEFPNKIWRQLVEISPSLNYAVQMRQYPNTHNMINDKVTEIIKDLLSKYCLKEMQSYTEVVENNDILRDLVSSNYDVDNRFYNDIQYESFDRTTVIMPKTFDNLEELNSNTYNTPNRIMVGNEDVYCACGCGCRMRNEFFFTCEYEGEDCDDD